MNDAIFEALENLSKESNIEMSELIEKIQAGIVKAVKKDYPYCEHIVVNIDPVHRIFDMKILKEVMGVMFVDDPDNEIWIGEAKNYDPNIKEGEWVEIPLSPAKFGRVAAQHAKQSIKHDIKDFERSKLVEQYQDKEHECISAVVKTVEPATLNAVVTIDKNDVYFLRKDQIPGEVLNAGDTIKVYVSGIANSEKRQPAIRISRTQRELVKRLFELEVPEIAEGTVEIMAISRVAGERSKIAVKSNDENVDAVGACIGPKKARISAVVNELKGEKIDVINWCENPEEFIAKALSPAEVIKVTLLEDEIKNERVQKRCQVIVPDNQLSLAIGNKGQNAKLAAGLTGYRIDIAAESTMKIDDEDELVADEETASDNKEITNDENTSDSDTEE